MAVSDDFREFVLEQLAPAGRVTSRAMFGGVGLYLDGLFFALIDDDTLYFKTDESNRARFQQAAVGGRVVPVAVGARQCGIGDAGAIGDRHGAGLTGSGDGIMCTPAYGPRTAGAYPASGRP